LTRSSGSPSRTNEGFALIISLWVLVLLSVLAMSFSFFTREEAMGARNFKEETRAYYAALSAHEDALDYLSGDKDLIVDYLDENGNLLADSERPGIAAKKEDGDFEVEVAISDEESRLNINTCTPEIFRRALEYSGVPDDEINGISDSVLDWKDPDDAHHMMGAESDYYEGLPNPYKAKNGLFDSVEELLLVKGFKRDYLYKGGKDRKPLAQLFTVYGDGINVNTASKELFEILGIDSPTIDKTIEDRKLVGGLKLVPPSFAIAGVALRASTHFRVEVSARPLNGKEKVKITSVLERTAQNPKKFRILYWREGIEYSRT
jgi:general secretion pathway protein K